MKKIIVLFLVICLMCLCLVSCQNKGDYIDIYNKKSAIFDNINIDVKDGYFYDRHEKFTADDNTIGVTIYFSKESKEDDSWD